MNASRDPAVIEPDALDELVAALRDDGYTVFGPTVVDGAIVYEELQSAEELPIGWTDVQGPGRYRLERRADEARFGYAVGPHSWKQFLLPPLVRLWQADKRNGSFDVVEDPPEDRRLALFGLRPCELHAIAIHDRVLVRGRFGDRDYAARREGAFVVAVNCFEPGGTCFCTSMGTGPATRSGYDLALTEILEGEHRFLVEAGSARGAQTLSRLPGRSATSTDLDAAERTVAAAESRMGRKVDATGLHELLADNLEHERWDDVAERCLTCGNCTLVCPTCFCTSVDDVTDLTGDHTERMRRWDSCFSAEYSYIHGGSVRPSARARYRQWLTHKFGTWWDQFETSGCVGCGRCITWCPVGIDVTEELAAIRAKDGRNDGDD